jgi:glycosyltransferase involved in cell wall biosynthesis
MRPVLDDESITFICDPLLSEYGPLRPALLIAEKLIKSNRRVTIVSTTVSTALREKLNSTGIQTVNLRKEPFLRKNESIAWLEEWVKEAAFSVNSRGIHNSNGITLNFSNTICTPSQVWYAQGPPTVTLNNMEKHLPLHYRIGYLSISPLLGILDEVFTRRIAVRSSHVVANSKYLDSVYRKFGVNVDTVIYPPLDCEQFKPRTSKPSGGFVLTYFGKETIFGLVKQVLDMGIKVKAFGGKLSLIPKKIREHQNLDLLGRVTDEELVRLYSNALFTFYPFTDEPFGYVPIESLACGTPVLTFNRQGPKETIINRLTGWLANDDSELATLAFQIWNEGYPKAFRNSCRERALEFDVNRIAKEWTDLINDTDPRSKEDKDL